MNTKAISTKVVAKNNGQVARVAVNKAAEQAAIAAQIGFAGVSGFLAGFFSKPAVAKPVAKKTTRRTK